MKTICDADHVLIEKKIKNSNIGVDQRPEEKHFVRRKSQFEFLLIFIFLFFIFSSSVHAQSTITAIPPRLVLEANPGQTLTAEIKVRNDSENSQIYTVAVEDFIVTDNHGTPIPIATSVSNRWSLKSWISAPNLVPVDAHSSQIVRLSVKVPLTAFPGGHYAMITYQPNAQLQPGELQKSGSFIGQRVGTLVYLTVKGPVTENAVITKFSVPGLIERGPVEFSGSVENLSGIHVNPTGSIKIFSPLGKLVAEITVEVGNIFPETVRDFSETWNRRWGWGKYQADLNLSYGTTGGVLTATIFFWFFPIRLIIYIAVVIISIILTIVILNKRNKRHQEILEREVTKLRRDLEEIEHP